MSMSALWSSLQPKDVLTLALSGASFLLAGCALWVAQFNHGQLKMTQPTLLCLKRELAEQIPKIFFRSLLFTTGSKGRVVETMFLRVHQPHGASLFGFWGHTEGGKLTIGSGLFVGPTGIASDHHFNPQRNSLPFLFVAGQWRIEVFASLVGQSAPRKLKEISFDMDGQQAAELAQIADLALFLTWNADSQTYEGRLDRGPKSQAVV